MANAARLVLAALLCGVLAWFSDYRKQHCVGVTCPPAPFPGAEPIECARVARCVRGKCAPACDDPSYKRGSE